MVSYRPANFRAIFPVSKQMKLLALFVIASLAYAQNVDNCERRSIVVNVRDQQGKLISGLQPASFRGVFSGQPVKVLSDKVQNDPRIVLLLDLSGSVSRSNHNLDTAQLLAGNFVAASRTPHIALVLFSDHILDTLGFDRTPKEVLQRLTNLDDGKGQTALLDSLMYSASLFHTPEPGDAVYIITDGGDNQSKSTEREVERELLSKNIRLFSFVLSDYAFPTEEELLGHSYIRHLTEVTGGMVIDAGLSQYRGRGHVEQLNASLQRTYNKIKSFYELEVELPRKLETEHQWELQVVDESGKRRKDIEIAYAKALPSCH